MNDDTRAVDDEFRDWDAAYVLGALTSDDRLRYERHLETCAACREAVADLAGMPGIMGRLPADDAVAVGAPVAQGPSGPSGSSGPRGASGSGAGASLADVAHRVRRRRSRRRVLAVAAAALAVVVGIGGGVAIGAMRPGPTTSVTAAEQPMRPVRTPAVLTAEIAVTGKAWGTRFDWSCAYGDGGWAPGSTADYDLVVTRDDGSTETVATWSATGDRAGGLSASTGIPRTDIRSVDIRLHGQDEPLVSRSL